MSLRQTIAELFAQAEAGSGESTRALRGGAVLTARVQGDKRQLIIARPGTPVGEIEERTFRRDGQVPATAERWPAEGQSEKDGRYRVAFTWQQRKAES